MRQGSFDLVLLPDNHETLHGHSGLLRSAAGLGYGPLDGKPFSDRLRNMVVLVGGKQSRRTEPPSRSDDMKVAVGFQPTVCGR